MDWLTQLLQNGGGGALGGGAFPPLGQSLEPSAISPVGVNPAAVVPTPGVDAMASGTSIPAEAAATQGGIPGPAADGSRMNSLLQTLRGVTAPARPDVQRVATQHPPALAKIQGGGLVDLLASLGVGPAAVANRYQLPSTLGQALGGGR